jgi:hypothetical protein
MQSKQELEDWYDNTDPWGYLTNKEDTIRLKKVLSLLNKNYHKALDIGAGEGFIAKHLPADMISGIELSETAKSRFPANVVPIKEPIEKYDLIISTGTLYEQYDHESIYKMIMNSASHHILIGGIKDWLINYDFGKEIKTIEFPYREFIQKITLYEISPSS